MCWSPTSVRVGYSRRVPAALSRRSFLALTAGAAALVAACGSEEPG
ncbi:twin-arginine translocation signal domain-containing protein, partial [Mycolicibacterium elephantis]